MGTACSKREVKVINREVRVINREVKVIINGLDAAGKTTFLYQAKLGEAVTTMPTVGFNVETIEHKNMSIRAWDIGGRDKGRIVNRHYLPNTQGYIYMVDSCDDETLEEARRFLHRTVIHDELFDCPVLILANKQDLPGAMSVERISEALCVQWITQTKCVMPVSATTGAGIPEALEWLYVQLQHKHRKASSLWCVGSRGNSSTRSTPQNEYRPTTESGKVSTSDNVVEEGLLSPTFVNKLWTSMGRLFWVRK